MAENSKVEARLDDVYAEALSAYMADRFLKNESEVLRSALGQLLMNAGYLRREGDTVVLETPHSPTRPENKNKNAGRVSYSGSKKRAKK